MRCPRCGSTANGFYKNSSRSSGLDGICKLCRKKHNDKWYEDTKEERLEYQQDYHSKHREQDNSNTKKWRVENTFGISIEEHAARLAKQGNDCALCGLPFYGESFGDGSPVLDHNHSTGKLREFIHSKCNLALGKFNDDQKVCRLAAEYLEKHMKGENA